MSISKVKFGELNGKTVYAYTLANKNGFSVEILNYGGIIRKIIFKNTDVVLGRDSLEEYLNNEGYFGALIGRNSNRIKNSRFSLSRKEHKLYANDGENNLHGGKIGFDKKIWDAKEVDEEETSLVLTCVSPDGEEGFSGNLSVEVTYTVTDDNALRIEYSGISDADTVFNMTNHAYFNLNGHNSGSIEKHSLWLDSDFYTPNGDDCVPNGEIMSVKNTPFDFNDGGVFEERFKAGHPQIDLFGGFDHNFALKGSGYRRVGALIGDKTGIKMEIYTDKVGVQLYTGNMIEEDRICKDGAVYQKHSALCLETQEFPNFLNFSHFPKFILRKNEKHTTTTLYKFCE